MPPVESPPPLVNRELTWLSFNRRVLQEAEDSSTPFFERLNFLAIVSSNLDEFFRVRVASLRSLMRLGKKRRRKLREDPQELLTRIHDAVVQQQEVFGELFRSTLLPGLRERGIHLVRTVEDARGLSELREHFTERVAPHLEPRVLRRQGLSPFLENGRSYLAMELEAVGSADAEEGEACLGLVPVPCPELPRFVTLPDPEEPGRDPSCRVLFLDDVIRMHLDTLFPGWKVGEARAVKLSRDADLHIDDEFSGDLVEAIKNALAQRDSGVPTRFLYDGAISRTVLSALTRTFGLEPEDMVEGGRYHNLSDLGAFPRCRRHGETFPDWPVRPDPALEEGVRTGNLFQVVADRDRLLHFPYQPYRQVVEFFQAASRDEAVEEIQLTVYRVSKESPILEALRDAAERGKRVHVFVEAKARFDEASNIAWGEELEASGVTIHHSFPDLKVHAKIAMVLRREADGLRRYAYLGTGNFNEKTALLYTDWGLLTADPRLTGDIHAVFRYLTGGISEPRFSHCLVAPFTLRTRLEEAIDAEIEAARAGRPAAILAKMNSLEDPDVIRRLYEAGAAGVTVRLIVRGICCLVTETGPWAGNIEVRSIVDRYLEHARAWVFHAGGDERMYLASADWMTRNLSRRIEVAFPLHDPEVRDRVRRDLELQWSDNVKARRIDTAQTNPYVSRSAGDPEIRAQFEAHHPDAPRDP